MATATSEAPSETEVKKILGGLEKFYEDWMFINNMLKELREEHPNKFIAVKSKKIIDSDSNLESLLKRLKEKGLNPSEIPIEFISKEPELLIA